MPSPNTIAIRTKSADEWLATRRGYIGGSEAAILLGVEKYASYYELWHRKKGGLEEPRLDSQRIILGTHLEEGVIAAAREIFGSTIRIVRRYVARTDIPMGASMDAEELVDGWVPCEIKVVAWNVWREDWAEDDEGDVHVPLHIAIQAQHYMGVTGAPLAVLYVLVGGEKVERIVLERREPIIQLIEQKVADFWRSQQNDDEPNPNYLVDFEAMRHILTNVAPEEKKPVDLTDDAELSVLMARYAECKRAGDAADAEIAELKARMLEHVGEHQKVKAAGGTISAKLKAATPEITKEITYAAKAQRRDFRVYLTKEKANG